MQVLLRAIPILLGILTLAATSVSGELPPARAVGPAQLMDGSLDLESHTNTWPMITPSASNE